MTSARASQTLIITLAYFIFSLLLLCEPETRTHKQNKHNVEEEKEKKEKKKKMGWGECIGSEGRQPQTN